MYIIKRSGEREKFKPEKLIRTLKRSGADDELAKNIAGRVSKEIRSGDTTHKILRLALKYLRQEKEIGIAQRYDLKAAFFRLGPQGFIFEKIMAEIFKENGYKISMPEEIKGKCISHEVDIVAEKYDERYMIECKYHGNMGFYLGSKDLLYIWGRYLDLIDNKKNRFNLPWVVSNAKFSDTSLNFAECRGIRITSWNYPKEHSLRGLIEEKKLYPITVIRELKLPERDELMGKNVFFCRNLINLGRKKIGIPPKRLKYLQDRAQAVFE